MAKDPIVRRLTTILSADVVGFSRLIGDDERGTLAALKAHRLELIEPKAVQYHGRIVKLMGDGVLMEFASVVDAVVFAIEVQHAMRERNADLPEDQRIIYRIGINIGDVIVEADDIYGDGVNVAARLEALAEPGNICVSRTVVNHVRGKVDLDFEDLGTKQVKNIAAPVKVFKVIENDKIVALTTPIAIQPPLGARKRGLILATAAVGLMSLFGFVWWLQSRTHLEPASVEKMTLSLPSGPSIAVLPFDNLNGDPEQDYFSDGMTEDLITDLSKVSGLFVIARNSSFAYKGQAILIPQVAEELGVRYVLEGSVRRSGDSVRVNAQLIDALSGYHVWAERYDEDMADIFSVQDRVVGQIVASLAINLGGAEIAKLASNGTESAEAYDNFLEGWQLYKEQTEEAAVAAISHFKQALEFDPEYGRAYAGLAANYWLIADQGWTDSIGLLWQETIDLAKAYLLEALAHPTAPAHMLSSDILRAEGKIIEALSEIEKAIALEPNNPDNYVNKAQILIHAGKPQEAEESARLAMRMNPLYETSYLQALGRALFYQERFAEAAEVLERSANRRPNHQDTFMRLAAAYGHLGRQEEAEAAIAQYNALSIESGYTPLTIQEVSIWQEDSLNFLNEDTPELFLSGLRKAGVPEGAAPAREDFDYKALVTAHYDQRGRYFEVDGAEKIGVDRVKELLAQDVVVIDVRDEGSFGRGHLPGAYNLDLNLALTQEALAAIAWTGEPVIFYCWGTNCSYSAFACAKARLWGYRDVYYFAGGFPAWKSAGNQIETSDIEN